MSIGYLAMLAMITICTALALAPLRATPRLGLISFFLGQVVNELPHLGAALMLAATALEVVEGNLDVGTPTGAVVTTIVGLTLLGQAELARRALAAPATLRDALRAGLGGSPTTLSGPAASRPRAHVLRWLFGFVPVRPWSVVRVANVAYGSHRRQRLDVYHRRARPSGAPVLIYLHGGGYFSGSKHHEARALVHRLARRGWVCLSADYRLRPEAGFVEHLTDAKAVIAWARQHVADWGGEARTVVICGSSAGGHLATLTAVTAGNPAFQRGFEDADTSVAAAIGLYGYYGSYYGRRPDDHPPSTPTAYDARNAPPTFLVSAANDSYVGTEGAERLADHLRAHSRRPVVHAVLPGAQHAFDVFRSLRFEAVVDAIEMLLDQVLDQPTPAVASDRGRSEREGRHPGSI